ncbi:hypothetical protein C2W62_20795 [Candidatus Entotheonella serta]|nr:hypothetical protein C2W62_20795 [Candidatus Entotheonella serta]
MSWFDISVGLIMLLGGIRSYFRGLTREVMYTIGLIAVFVLAIWGYAYVPRYVEPIIASPWWRQIAVYIVLVLVAAGVYMLWAKMVERMLYVSRLSIPDRVLGGLFGIVKVGVVMAALFVLLIQATPDRVATVVPGSKLAPPLLQTSEMITTMLPREVKHEFRRAYSRIRQQFGGRAAQPSHPAPAAFHSHSQAPKSPADISENDDHALRQLIKKYSKEQ